MPRSVPSEDGTSSPADVAGRPGGLTAMAVTSAVAVTLCILATADSAACALLWVILAALKTPVEWVGWAEGSLLALSAVPGYLLFRHALGVERALAQGRYEGDRDRF